MSHARPFQRDDSVEPEPLPDGCKITIVHLNGTERKVIFEGLYGDKCNQPVVRWPLSGAMRVNFETGQLSPKKVSLWRVTETDLARIHATSRQHLRERQERKKRERGYIR